MKLIDLFEQQIVIKGSVIIPRRTITLVGYKHQGKPIAQAKVLGTFKCSYTKIKSLEEGPSYVGGNFYCSYTKITSLEGAPSYVGGIFSCYQTNITSLHNIHKQIKHIGSRLLLPDIKSHIIGVIFIKGLQGIEFSPDNTEQKQVAAIVNKHLAGNRNIHLAQEELIEAGLAEFAKL